MTILSKKQPDTWPKARYVELMQQSLQPHEAEYIVHLEFKDERCAEEERMLELLHDSATRQCAEVILNLESRQRQENASHEEVILLPFLLNNLISEDVKRIVANQYRKQALRHKQYISWFSQQSDIETASEVDALWYPPKIAGLSACMALLVEKTNQSSHEARFLQLISDENTRKHALDMIVLENTPQRSPYEEAYLQLLLDSSTRAYAKKMLDLTRLAHKTPQQTRELALLSDPDTRAYAEIMMTLEFKQIRSLEETKYLNLLSDPFTRRFATLIMEKDNHAYDDLTPQEIEILKDCFLHRITPVRPFGKRVQSPLASVSILSPRPSMSSRTLLQAPYVPEMAQDGKKNTIQNLINLEVDEIIRIYFDKNHANATMKNKGIDPATTPAMMTYITRNKHHLSFAFIQYFYLTEQKFYEVNLKKLVTLIKNKIHDAPKKNLCVLAEEAIRERIAIALLNTEEQHSPNPSNGNLASMRK